MTVLPPPPVNYMESSRRHLKDAHILLNQGSKANAGQLFGFAVECGLKALALACGVVPDTEGGVPERHKFRSHMPTLYERFVTHGALVPDSGLVTKYRAMLPSIRTMNDWGVEHRYFRISAIPLASLSNWEMAALEINEMLDQAIVDGVM
jgi:hypothetical protein